MLGELFYEQRKVDTFSIQRLFFFSFFDSKNPHEIEKKNTLKYIIIKISVN